MRVQEALQRRLEALEDASDYDSEGSAAEAEQDECVHQLAGSIFLYTSWIMKFAFHYRASRLEHSCDNSERHMTPPSPVMKLAHCAYRCVRRNAAPAKEASPEPAKAKRVVNRKPRPKLTVELLKVRRGRCAKLRQAVALQAANLPGRFVITAVRCAVDMEDTFEYCVETTCAFGIAMAAAPLSGRSSLR